MQIDRQLSQYEIKKALVNSDPNEMSTNSNSPKEGDQSSRALV